jgi:hypothetical protein
LTDSILYALGSATSGGSKKPVFTGRLTIAQVLTTGTTPIALTLDAEDDDYDNGHSTSTNTSRYTAQSTGRVLYGGVAGIAPSAVGNRDLKCLLNGTPIVGGPEMSIPGFATNTNALTTGIGEQFMNAGDFLELAAWQSSGGNLNVTFARLTVIWFSN